MCKKLFYLILILGLELVLTDMAEANDPNLVSWWKLDEGTGLTAYDSAGTNDGTITSATWTTGRIGGALNFDGTDDKVNCGTDSSLNLTETLTISAWVKRSRTGGTVEGIFSRASSWSGVSYMMYTLHVWGYSDRFAFRVSNGTSLLSSLGLPSKSADTWYHVTGSYDSTTGTTKLYVDGVLEASATDASFGSLNSRSPTGIGYDPLNGNRHYFAGIIDDIRIYNKELTSQEVQDIYTGINQAPVITSVTASPSTISDAETSQLQVNANDPDSGPNALTYSWTVPSGQGSLNNSNIADPIYTPPDVSTTQTFTLSVNVSDGADITPSTVDITVTDEVPVGPTLVGHWKFDEGTGTTAYDETANNNDGTITGATWTTGKFGSALAFDGDGDYVSFPGQQHIPDGSPFTIAAWVYWTAAPFGRSHVYGRNSNTVDSQTGLYMYDSGDFRLQVSNGSARQVVVLQTVQQNQWVHVVGVYDGSTIQGFTNGVASSPVSVTLSGTVPNISAGIYGDVINRAYLDRYFTGKVDEVMVYGRALTEQEIQVLYNNSSLLNHWKLDEGTGSIAYDSWGENDGTIIGATWTTGMFFGALNFNGSGDYVQISPVVDIYNDTSNTISVWCKNTDTEANTKYAIAWGSTAGNTSQIKLGKSSNDHKAYFYISSGTSGQFASISGVGPLLNDNNWHMLTVVRSAIDSFYLYVDGDFVGQSMNSNVSLDLDCNSLLIGAYQQTSYSGHWLGQIDDIRIFDDALSAQEISQLYGVTSLPFKEDFNDGNFDGWTLVDQGTEHTPMSWSALTNVMVQSSNVYTIPTGSEIPKLGTYAYWEGGSTWKDYKAKLTIKSADDDTIGFMFRYQDPNNYYRFSWDKSRNYRRLVKCVNGLFSLLAEDSVPYVTDQNYELEIIADGNSLEVYIDNNQILLATDNSISSGTIALYCWGNVGSYFDDISVTFTSSSQVSYWKFDEGTGSTASDSLGYNDGTVIGASWVTGLLGGALNFDGNGDYVDVGNNISLEINITNSDVTISAWVYPKALANYEPVFIADDNDGAYYGYMLMITPNGNVWLSYGDGMGAGLSNRRTKTGTTSLQINNWYHVVGVIRGATDMSIFIDGIDDAGTYSGSGGNISYSSASASIGRVRFGTLDNEFAGIIDEVMVFNRALTEGEVRILPVLLKRGIPMP